MGLKGYVPPTVAIPLDSKGENSFTVRGVSLDDLSELVRTHMPSMVMLLNYSRLGMDQNELMTRALLDAPIMSGHLIGLASGEPGAFAQAMTLPFPIQMDAIREIVKLTFEVTGGAGNGFAAMLSVLKQMDTTRLELADAAAVN